MIMKIAPPNDIRSRRRLRLWSKSRVIVKKKNVSKIMVNAQFYFFSFVIHDNRVAELKLDKKKVKGDGKNE